MFVHIWVCYCGSIWTDRVETVTQSLVKDKSWTMTRSVCWHSYCTLHTCIHILPLAGETSSVILALSFWLVQSFVMSSKWLSKSTKSAWSPEVKSCWATEHVSSHWRSIILHTHRSLTCEYEVLFNTEMCALTFAAYVCLSLRVQRASLRSYMTIGGTRQPGNIFSPSIWHKEFSLQLKTNPLTGTFAPVTYA